jgi:glycosyltransferase involved in cell wall biosynthesis
MYKNSKKIAICILTFNRIKFLKQTIDSVLSSEFKNYRIFVFDNNSSDGTGDYLSLLDKNKTITVINHRDNLTQFESSNYILENIKSEYIILLHDDDTINKSHLDNSFKLIESDKNISVVGTGWNMIDEDNNFVKEALYANIKNEIIFNDSDFIYHHIRGLQFPLSGALIRMDKVKDLRFDYNYGHYADTPFLIKLTRGNNVGYIPKLLFNYRVHKDQISQAGKFEALYSDWLNIFDFYKNYLSEVNNTKENFKILKKANTKTNFANIIASPNLKYFFKIIFRNEYFNIFFLKPKELFRIIHKFFKLLFSIK